MNKTVDSSDYLKILKKNLRKTMTTHNCKYFQHDNARIYTAKKKVKFLQDINVNVIKWPCNSPDIAPIDNIFGWMKKHLEGRDIRTIQKLKNELRRTLMMLEIVSQ